MPRRLFQLAVVTTLVFVIGVHWIVLQSVAWTGMIIIYAQAAPLRVALVKTFDGKHPCQLCKVVQAGKQAEQKQLPKQQLTTKLDFFCNPEWLAVEPPPAFPPPVSKLDHSPDRTETPPSPPPRPV